MNSNNHKNNVLVFIPTYNEIGNVQALYQAIKKQISCDLLFCDDNSPDGTGEFLNQLAQQDPSVHVIHRPKKMGLGTAHLAGFKYAKQHQYEAIITMDADFTHDPAYLPAMLSKKSEAHIVIGSRYAAGARISGWNKIRLPFTIFWRDAIKYGLGMPYDCTAAFRLYNVQILHDNIINTFKSKGFSFNIEALYAFKKHGARIIEVPIHAQQRVHGKSKLSIGIMAEMAKQYFKILFDRLFGKRAQKIIGH